MSDDAKQYQKEGRHRGTLGNGSKVLALSSHPELGRPNSGKILEGIFPSMGLKNPGL